MPGTAGDDSSGPDEDVPGDDPSGLGELDGRVDFLEAGVRLLASLSREDLVRVVSASAVSAEAGLSRQTFYRRWSNHADFVDDLITYVTDPSRSSASERLADLEEEAEAVDPEDPASEVRRLSGQTFGRFNGDPTQVARTLLWAVHRNDAEVAQHLRGLYTTNDQAAAVGFGRIGEVWGIEPRPPFTLETVALLFNALRDGLILHLGIDPERVPASFRGDVMVAVTTAIVRRIGDPDDEIDVDEVFRRAVEGTPLAGGDTKDS